jgi:hypothetical protein
MNVKLVIQVAPGEEGMAESHSYTLKEAKTPSQVWSCDARVRPFLGSLGYAAGSRWRGKRSSASYLSEKGEMSVKGRSKKSASRSETSTPTYGPVDDGATAVRVERVVCRKRRAGLKSLIFLFWWEIRYMHGRRGFGGLGHRSAWDGTT